MSGQKKYGLILPDKSKIQPTFKASRNVFGEDSDSDENTGKKKVPLHSTDAIKKQVKLAQEKAILEDPTVYQYDEIYDSMSKKLEDKKSEIKSDKKPKYIENLIKSANKRKIENERRVERQIQKERENEGEEFADKEVFVTSAYKKKLEELQKEEEREKYEEYLESIGDVTKQKDLGGFYRHLYEQKLGPKDTEKLKTPDENVVKEQPNSSTKVLSTEHSSSAKSQTQRNYRKRKSSNDINLSEGEIEDSEEEINRCNLKDIRISKKSQNSENIDADSDFSIDDSSDEDATEKDGAEKENTEKPKEESITKEKSIETNVKKEQEPEKPKVKIDIWKKRCVGELFDQALKRYYERKAARCN